MLASISNHFLAVNHSYWVTHVYFEDEVKKQKQKKRYKKTRYKKLQHLVSFICTLRLFMFTSDAAVIHKGAIYLSLWCHSNSRDCDSGLMSPNILPWGGAPSLSSSVLGPQAWINSRIGSGKSERMNVLWASIETVSDKWVKIPRLSL